MKRTILFAAIAALTINTGLSAQTVLDDIKINDAGLNRNDSYMTADMDIDLSGFALSSNRAVILTPYIVKDTIRQALPSLGFYGKNRYYYYVRNGQDRPGGKADTAYRDNDMPEYLPYLANVPYEAWMQGAQLVLEKKVYGCCTKELETSSCSLDKYLIYEPEYVYVRPPKVGTKKSRSLEGVAYVDYPVSQTVIYKDYHNNRTELAKIEDLIDSVKFDPDVTITSIFVKGYASPESPYDNNTRLAKGRTQAIKQYVLDLYNDIEADLISTAFEPENWEGLREYLVKSKLPNKKAIIALVDGPDKPDRKEWLIKSRYPADYKVLLKDCYPFLRRTDYRIEYDIHSFTDVEHIKQLVKTRPQKLNLDEFYLAAENLEPGTEDFQEVFDVAVRMFPEDKIANLNAANVAMQRGDYRSADNFISRAGDGAEAVYARGVWYALQGDYTKAISFFETSKSLGISEAVTALDIVNQLLTKNNR